MNFRKPVWWSTYMERPAVTPPFQAQSATVGVVEPALVPRPPLKYLLTGLGLLVMLALWMSSGGSDTVKKPPTKTRTASIPQANDGGSLKGLGIVPGQSDLSPQDRLNIAEAEQQKRLMDTEIAQRRAACAAGITQACVSQPGMQGSQQAGYGGSGGTVTPQQTAAEERRKQEEQSLESSTLVPIPEPDYRGKIAATLGADHVLTARDAPATQTPDAMPKPAVPLPSMAATLAPERVDCKDTTDNGHILYALCEGTVIPAVLDNRIEGEFAGPVKAYTLVDVLSRDKHRVLPVGSIVLGEASAVQKANQRRIEASFHRMLLPNGDGVKLNKIRALDQAGETALAGKVNNHALKAFGTAAIVGALAGFSQFGAGSAYTGNGFDAYRQQAAAGVAREGQQMLQRDLDRLPTIQIPEGKLILIYLNTDLYLPEYKPATMEGAKK